MAQSPKYKAIVASLSNFLVAGTIVAGGSGLTLWEKYLGLTESDLGLLSSLSINCLSGAIGALFGGFLADKYGRKNVFSYSMLAFMLGIGLTATSTTLAQLLFAYILTGLAGGMTLPSSWSYIAESVEINRRGRAMAFSQFAWGFGPAIMLALGTIWSPGSYGFDIIRSLAQSYGIPENHTHQFNVFASRITFGILFVVSMITWVWQHQLEESEEWNKISGKAKRSSLFSSASIIFRGKNRKTILWLAGMYICWNTVASLMGFFQTHIYENMGGISLAWANRFNVWQWVLTCVITFFGRYFIDKANHRRVFNFFISCAIMAWILVIIFGMESLSMLIIITVLWAVQAGLSVQLFFALWGTESFPTRYRAAAMGIMLFLSRGLSTIGSIVFTQVWSEEAFIPCAICMLSLLIIAAYLGWNNAPETRNKSLAELNHEE